jgi:hypothetical protein
LLRRALKIPTDLSVRATKPMAESLAELITRVWNSMRLAGEMGSLLKIDRELQAAIEQGRAEWEERLPLFRVTEYGLEHGVVAPMKENYVRVVPGDQDDFWQKAEKLVLQALADYANSATAADATRRRLFAGDAARGFAFVDLISHRFDVVLMNPPFSAVTEGTRILVESLYPDSRCDIGAMFIEEFSSRISHRGRLGAIFNRTNWFLERLARFRSHQLRHYSLASNADLGLGVLDAFVETALTVVEATHPNSLSYWIRLVDTDEKARRLRQAVNSIQSATADPSLLSVDQSIFLDIEAQPYSYWVPAALLSSWRQKSLADLGFEAKQGLASARP